MIYFEELFFEGALVYKEPQVVPLEKQGLAWLTAVNYDSKKGSNGGGKSTIPRLLQTVLYKLATDSIMYGKKNFINGVKFRTEKAHYIIVQYRKLDEAKIEAMIKEYAWKPKEDEKFPKTGYLIIKNGKDITPHGIPACRKKIARIFVLTEAEFLGTVAISPTRAHTLIGGTAPERRKYFENVFSILSTYKRLQEKIGERYDKANATVKELTEVSGQLKSLREQLAEFKEEDVLNAVVIDINKKYVRIEREKSKLDAEISEIDKMIFRRKKRNEIIAQLELLKVVTDDEHTEAEADIPTFKSKVKAVSEQISVRKIFDSQKKAFTEVKEKLADLDKEIDYKAENEAASKALAVLDSKIESKKDFYRDLTKLNLPQCPTCKQSLDQATIQKNISSLKEEIQELEIEAPKIEAKVTSTRKAASAIAKYRELKESLAALNAPEQTIEELNERLESWESKIESCEATVDLYQQRATVKQTLKNYPSEEMPERTYYEGIKVKANDLDVDLKVAIKEKSEYEYQLTQVVSLKKKATRAEEQLVDFEKIKDRLKILDVLYVAYGDRGLKLKQITNLCKKLVERLGIYSPLMFQERNLQFSQNTEKENFDIVAIRNYNGKKKQIDISEFSGGERKRLIPGLVLAQRDLLPNNKKTNLLILDELDANLDPIAKQAFVNNLLPLLKKKFESTVIIAHSTDMDSSLYDKRWQIERKGGQSTLITAPEAKL
jgi:DNA repair exonuclease SbcCD ATPase subunit